MAKIQKMTIPNVGDDTQQQKLSFNAAKKQNGVTTLKDSLAEFLQS